jgi:hypothetical protein
VTGQSSQAAQGMYVYVCMCVCMNVCIYVVLRHCDYVWCGRLSVQCLSNCRYEVRLHVLSLPAPSDRLEKLTIAIVIGVQPIPFY